MFGYDWPRLHAALNDLPAAVLLVAVIFDVLSAITKRASLRIAGYWTMLVGAIGGVLAVLAGLQAEEHIAHGEAVHAIMETHEKLAFVTLGIFAVLALWRIFRESKMGSSERGLSLLLSIGGVVALLATSILGGNMVFDHAAGIPTEVLETEIQARSEGHHHDDSGASDSAAPSGGHTHPPGTPPHKD